MTRDEAYRILTTYLKNKNLIKHCLAAEAVMKEKSFAKGADRRPILVCKEKRDWK